MLIICPPLLIQLFQRKWKTAGLRIKLPSLKEALIQLASIPAFILYKVGFLREVSYIKFLSCLANLLVERRNRYVFVHYQDYIMIEPYKRSDRVKDICEFIISTSPSAGNYHSSINAASLADVVIMPSASLSSIVTTSYIAPYGGNKVAYRKTTCSANNLSFSSNAILNKSFIICARANSRRKGLDILLHSLLLLNKKFDHANKQLIQVRICGSIASYEDDALLKHTIKSLGEESCICISAAQYSQDAYTSLISSCDLFVMPSRLESTSLAALEALWLGVPSILSRECGVDAFVDGRHGVLLESLTSYCLSDALYSMISNPKALLDGRENLTLDKDIFSWTRYLQAYKNILSDLAI